AFLAEIIFTYIIKKNLYKKRVMLRYKEIILHIITAAILIPFIINIFVDLVNSYDNIYNSAESSSQEIYSYILDDISGWDERERTNLQLSGIIEMGLLKESILKATMYKPYNIYIKDKNNRNILAVHNYEEDIVRYEEYTVKRITDKLSQALPKNKAEKYFDNSWKDGYFIFNQLLESIGLTVEIEIPIELYNDRIIKEYLSQFKFLMLFALFIGFISMLLNKTIFNNLTKLSIYTKDLPDKLEKDISIDWPVSNIVEISVLTDNIQNMSINLSKNFEKLNESQRKLYELAYYDTLTRLPNRLFFKKYLEGLAQNTDISNRFCVMFIDLNRFKVINDTWGHDTGDKLLSEVASRLKNLKSDKFNIFRLGGDEFVTVIKVDNDYEIEKCGRDIISVFNEDFKIDDLVLSTSCSIGASVFPDDSRDADTIIKYADIAMYDSKENGGNFLQVFNEEIKSKVVEKMAIESEINNALAENQFILYYQPKFSGIDRSIKSLEALIRWTSTSLGVISPEKFIPIAEESDLILEIDKWVIYEACKENKRLQDIGYIKIPVSVNISAKHFAHKEILDIVVKALDKSGLEAKYLTVEITEGVLIKNVDMVSDIIRDLKKIGVLVSIDDFGKGYSSLNQLMTLPINEVKIDRDFIKDISKEKKKRNVVSLIVELAHSLELNVVAEGIETVEERNYLESIGCDELQGYLFSKPVNIEELLVFLRKE
ncbi:MAG: putative bifunctional diguanylate cyclase/phosphodiesterase, partial [Clostridium sp.]